MALFGLRIPAAFSLLIWCAIWEVVGQLLVSVIALGRMFSRYSRSSLLEAFWALTLILFAVALGLSAAIGYVEQRIEYYAGTRQTT